MIALTRAQAIDLALKPETEIGVQHVKVELSNGQEVETYVHDFQWIDLENHKASDIKTIEVLEW